jgi:SAM-dependent methyltransferase
VDPSEIVRQGYNKIAPEYLAARCKGRPDPPVLGRFSDLLRGDSLVLDAGCGAGVPVTRFLAQRHRVVGVDFSMAQARLASKLVPTARIACLDMTKLAFPPNVFDGICSFFAILHIPRSQHRDLLAALHRILRVDGLALLCLGDKSTVAAYGPYLRTNMFWSHFDRGEYLEMLAATGFKIISSQIEPDPISKIATHLFVLARKVDGQQLGSAETWLGPGGLPGSPNDGQAAAKPGGQVISMRSGARRCAFGNVV